MSQDIHCAACHEKEKDYPVCWLHLETRSWRPDGPTYGEWDFCSGMCLAVWLTSNRSPGHPIHDVVPRFLQGVSE